MRKNDAAARWYGSLLLSRWIYAFEVSYLRRIFSEQDRFGEIRDGASSLCDLFAIFTDDATKGVFRSYSFGKPADDAGIASAESVLGLRFSAEYRAFLSECGCLSFRTRLGASFFESARVRLCGVSRSPAMSVVRRTLKGRAEGAVPPGYYVLSPLCRFPQPCYIVQDAAGAVFIASAGLSPCYKIADSLFAYLIWRMEPITH